MFVDELLTNLETPMLTTALRYAKQRHHLMRMNWGGPYRRPLWPRAIVYGVVRAWRLESRAFNRWCDEVDDLFTAQTGWLDWSYTYSTGRDCWIDGYAEGMSPQEAVDNEMENWD